MEPNKLTKSEARKLIAPVVDNEASIEERNAFMAYIAHDKEINREYESMKRIKTLIANRYSRAEAPETLKDFVTAFCSSSASNETNTPIYDIPSKYSVSQHSKPEKKESSVIQKSKWFYAATIILMAISTWFLVNFYGFSNQNPIYEIEEYAYRHFIKNEGKLIPPTISTASLGTAEARLSNDFDLSITVPKLNKAEFKGVVYQEFVPDYKAPMLEYYLSSQNQFIYIFAFKLDQIEKFGQLVRDREAAKTCTKPKDFYVREINGKHVVSWKWNDVWYAAISNHNGNTLASLVESLGPDQSSK